MSGLGFISREMRNTRRNPVFVEEIPPTTRRHGAYKDESWCFLPFSQCHAVPMCPKSKRKLLNVNRLLFLFHASLAITVCVANTEWNLRVPLYRSSLEFNISSGLLQPSYIEAGNLYFTHLTFSFFALSAFFHFGAGFLWSGIYLTCIEHATCPFRWLEYFFSASVMFAVIAYPCGVLGLELLLACLALIATTMLFGLLTEWIARPVDADTWNHPVLTRLTPHLLGYFPQLSAWILLLMIFVYNTSNSERSPPDFVYAIVAAELVFFLSFGAVQLLQVLKPPSWYIYGEYCYQALSLLSKGVLGIVLLTQVLFYSNYSCVLDSSGTECV